MSGASDADFLVLICSCTEISFPVPSLLVVGQLALVCEVVYSLALPQQPTDWTDSLQFLVLV